MTLLSRAMMFCVFCFRRSSLLRNLSVDPYRSFWKTVLMSLLSKFRNYAFEKTVGVALFFKIAPVFGV